MATKASKRARILSFKRLSLEKEVIRVIHVAGAIAIFIEMTIFINRNPIFEYSE